MTDSLETLTALDLRDALAAGRLSAREVTAHHLAVIEARNLALGAFVAVTGEQAMRDAADLDQRFARTGPVGPLHGLPMGIKDLTDVAGVPTGHGSAALPDVVPTEDAPLVATLRRAGVVVVGKTQVPEFGLSCHSESRTHPPARLPQDPRLSPGGSSGGSAAAVAAGMLPFAVGTDGGGSVRIPAAACGLVGLKPNRGRIATGSGQADLGRFVVAGPIARTAADAALLLDVLAGDVNHRALTAAPVADPTDLTVPGPLRIGVTTASPFASAYDLPVAPAAHAALDAGVTALEQHGHRVEEMDPGWDPRYPEAFATVWTTGVGLADLDPDAEARLTPLAREFRARARRRPATDLARAIDVLQQIEWDTVAAFARYDVVLTPALADTPRPIGWYTGADWDVDADTDYRRQCQYTPWTSALNVVGLPAVTATTGWTRPDPAGGPEAQGLPMGVQLIGRPSGERTLLALAHLLHRTVPGGVPLP
ncbi:amidase [Tersicoccus phoenicis]|uniref:Amidase n=1 Tax=Tersicoccus phoenicis TaxID=554083 RepID=A0A1R1LD16_9MICC|nr:amidase [Tersicoccus phoenicis]OMH25417.1 amidase [Tersicoccus phoenicis]